MENALSQDRSLFESRIRHHCALGEQELRTSGAHPDPTLRSLLLARTDDQRYGVNLVVHPPASVVHQILAIQQHLKAFEPQQYYYPSDDLHVTILEVLVARPLQPIASMAALVREHLDQLFQDLPTPQLDTPLLVFDQHACALNFLPTDNRLQTLRRKLDQRLTSMGIPLTSRYPLQSAHLTLMRYVSPLRTEMEAWMKVLLSVPLQPDLSWTIDHMTLTWGANWYGMRTSIQEDGPHSF
jgi:2'-5' RNA ligase